MTGFALPDATGWAPPPVRKGVWESLYEKYVGEELDAALAARTAAAAAAPPRSRSVAVDTSDLPAPSPPLAARPHPPASPAFVRRSRPRSAAAPARPASPLRIEDLGTDAGEHHDADPAPLRSAAPLPPRPATAGARSRLAAPGHLRARARLSSARKRRSRRPASASAARRTSSSSRPSKRHASTARSRRSRTAASAAKRARTKKARTHSSGSDQLARFIAATQQQSLADAQRVAATPPPANDPTRLAVPPSRSGSASGSLSPDALRQLSFLRRVEAVAKASAEPPGSGSGSGPGAVHPRRISVLVGKRKEGGRVRRASMFEIGAVDAGRVLARSMNAKKKRRRRRRAHRSASRGGRTSAGPRSGVSGSSSSSLSGGSGCGSTSPFVSTGAGTLFTSAGGRRRAKSHMLVRKAHFSPLPSLPADYLRRQHDEAAQYFEKERKRKAEEEKQNAYKRSMLARIRFEKERKARLKREKAERRRERVEAQRRERLAHATTAAICVELQATVQVKGEVRERKRMDAFRDTLAEWCQNHATRVHQGLVRIALQREAERREEARIRRLAVRSQKRDRVIERKRSELRAARAAAAAQKLREREEAEHRAALAREHLRIRSLRHAVFVELEERAEARRDVEAAAAEQAAQEDAFTAFLARQAAAADRVARLRARLQTNPGLADVEWGIPPTQDEQLGVVLDKIVRVSQQRAAAVADV